MELDDLKQKWEQYDALLKENVRVNKIILKKMLSKKPLWRIRWMQFKSGFLVISQIVIIFLLFSLAKTREVSWQLYFATIIISTTAAIGIIWESIIFYHLGRIDFNVPIIELKIQMKKLLWRHSKMLQWGILASPLILLGMALVLPFNRFPSEVLHSGTVLLMIGIMLVAAIMGQIIRWLVYRSHYRRLDQNLREMGSMLDE